MILKQLNLLVHGSLASFQFFPIFATLFKEFYTTRNALLSVTCCFVFGMIFHIPLSFQNKVVPVNSNVFGNMSSTTDLYESKENGAVTASCVFKSYILISEVFLRFGPILVLTVLNPLIICKFRKVSRNKVKVRGKQAAAAALSLHHNDKTAKIKTLLTSNEFHRCSTTPNPGLMQGSRRTAIFFYNTAFLFYFYQTRILIYTHTGEKDELLFTFLIDFYIFVFVLNRL
mgnify:CR=1 FL=1